MGDQLDFFFFIAGQDFFFFLYILSYNFMSYDQNGPGGEKQGDKAFILNFI